MKNKRFLLVILILFFKSSLYSDYKEQTRIRVGKPKPTYRTYSGYPTVLDKVIVEVKNSGENEAKDVKISGTDCNGDAFQLYGDKNINAKKKAIYTGHPNSFCVKDKKVKIESSCDNCR